MKSESVPDTLVIEFGSDEEHSSLFHSLEKSLKLIEESLQIRVSSRGNKIFLKGDENRVKIAEKIIRDLRQLSMETRVLTPDDIRHAIKSVSEGDDVSLRELFLTTIPVGAKHRLIIPKTQTQKSYIDAIRNHDMVIGIGPAGTGKTYLAMAMAINAFLRKQISRIVLARPAIEAGEKLGFLPGDKYEQVNPTKQKQALTAEALRPCVQRAMTDPDLRDDLLAAFVAARGLYGQMAKGRGVRGKAEKVSEKDFQKHLQGLVAELSDASERIQGKAKRKSHKARNRVILLTGVTLGVLYNPWTGQATRDWIMERVAGGDGDGLDEFASELSAETAAAGAAMGEAVEEAGETAVEAGNGSEP